LTLIAHFLQPCHAVAHFLKIQIILWQQTEHIKPSKSFMCTQQCLSAKHVIPNIIRVFWQNLFF